MATVRKTLKPSKTPAQLYKEACDDPPKWVKFCWPDIILSEKQKEMMYSVRDYHTTFVHAANMMGKDFVAGLIILWWMSSRLPARVLTTSVDGDQLHSVLWGEIRRFHRSSRIPLGIELLHDHAYRTLDDGTRDPISEIIAKVAKRGEGLLGRHTNAHDFKPKQSKIPRSLLVCDEASAMDNNHFDSASTWTDRMFIFGNCFDTTNRFYTAWKRGPLYSSDKKTIYENVIRVRADESENVVEQKVVIPGMMTYEEYQKRLATWDKKMITIGLHAEFYEGEEVRLYPLDWRLRANAIAKALNTGNRVRTADTMGVDVAEGGDSSVWTIVDRLGIIHQHSEKTPDTMRIRDLTLEFMRRYNIKPENILFDRGGGGKQIADLLRRMGYNVRTVLFGEAADIDQKKKHWTSKLDQRDNKETRTTYKNRRAEMYGLIRYELLDPIHQRWAKDREGHELTWLSGGFGIPEELAELNRQMAPIPLTYDPEGKLYILPKNKKSPDSTEPTLKELLGSSPDELDSLVLAVFGLFNKKVITILG